jgi:hypothetical protein
MTLNKPVTFQELGEKRATLQSTSYYFVLFTSL